MVFSRRAFNKLPCYLQTTNNNREYFIADDIMFEPHKAGLLTGYIGSNKNLTQEDLDRKPMITSNLDEQLSLGVTINKNDLRSGGAFYSDLIAQINNNGGITSNEDRLFSTNYYSWNPPVDFDKLSNFPRYHWVGNGNAEANGVYTTKEHQGSITTIHQYNGEWISHNVSLTKTNGLWEDENRTIFNDSKPLEYIVVDDFPENPKHAYYYIRRAFEGFQKPVVLQYNGMRWISKLVCVGPEPDVKIEGMIWEDATNESRILKIYKNGLFTKLDYETNLFQDETKIYYDNRTPDSWSVNNHWRHFDDLSPVDRAKLSDGDNAIRPIIEFWSGIEPTNEYVDRNSKPLFQIHSNENLEYVDHDSTIFEYKRGSGRFDSVLDMPLSYNNSGEFQFELTLETDAIDCKGYRYFKDSITGKLHSIWTKTNTLTKTDKLPISISSNTNHDILSVCSRSQYLEHVSSVIESQDGFVGNKFGINSYRWSNKDHSLGATLVDCETTLLRALATLTDDKLDIPNSIRFVSKEYNKVLNRFINTMNGLWDNNTLSNYDGSLRVSSEDAVDAILTKLFIGRSEKFPYHYSDMGTYKLKQISNGNVVTINETVSPIYIPSSPTRVGVMTTYKPELIGDKILNHDGSVIESFNDSRDTIWLELQNRFYDAVPDQFKKEDTFSASHTPSSYNSGRYFGGFKPNVVGTVSGIKGDSISGNGILLDIENAKLALFDGDSFKDIDLKVDDIYLNTNNNKYYMYNGFKVIEIKTYNTYDFDYSINEQKVINKREFERWATNVDFTNDTFDENDPFTWNYRSSGIEGHYKAIYKRLFRTDRLDTHPWEALLFHTKPTWWDTRYATHDVWSDIKNGIVNGVEYDYLKIEAPLPIKDGKLINPIEAGIVSEDDLVPSRLGDDWTYGDGGPDEQRFYESFQYPFSQALLGYLSKTGVFVDTLWTELYRDIGMNEIHNGPHVVHSVELKRTNNKTLPVHGENKKARIGLNTWISEYITNLSGDITRDFGDVIRNAEVSLAWKCNGFIKKDRTNIATLGGKQIPFEDVHTILHRSKPHKEEFVSGIAISKQNEGYVVYGYDLFKPYFTINKSVSTLSNGLTEIRQSLQASEGQNEFVFTDFRLNDVNDTSDFKVLNNGLLVDDKFYRIENGKLIFDNVKFSQYDVITGIYITTASNTRTQQKSFKINEILFSYTDAGSNENIRIDYGHYFETAPDVIDFMLSYGRYLESKGFKFNKDFLDGAKGFAEWVVNTNSVWNGSYEDVFYFSPFSDGLEYVSEFGYIMDIENDHNGGFGVVNKDALPIDPRDTNTYRIENKLVVESGEEEIFGIRILTAIDQHVVFFSNKTKFNDLVYDPVLAMYQQTLVVDSYRTHDWFGRLEAKGFIINNSELLDNFEKQAKDISNYYDRINTNDDPLKRDQARELYGWTPNDSRIVNGITSPYMNALSPDERSKFDYHRGMIHQKGTIKAVEAFNKGTRIGNEKVNVNEDWAWKNCSFGDTRIETIQIKVENFKDRIQKLEFNQNPKNDPFIQIPSFDRSNPNAVWKLPPKADFCFPYREAYIKDTKTSFKMFNDDGTVVSRLFHYDPLLGDDYNNPNALCEIDFIGHLDPARYEGSNVWGDDHVGMYWWDQTNHNLIDYYTLDEKYKALNWGKLKYFNSNISREDDDVTVELLESYGVTPTLIVGEQIRVFISGADQNDYNGYHTVTVSDTNKLSFKVSTLPVTPATGNIVVKLGSIDIKQWVKSPVKPNEWKDYISGTDLTGIADTDYVMVENIDSNRNRTVNYYFWVSEVTNTNVNKNLTSDVVASMIENPTSYGHSWFGVINKNDAYVYAGNIESNDTSIEIVFDSRVLDNHVDWSLVSEGDEFKSVPTHVIDKLVSSIAGKDRNGGLVPLPQLTDNEKYGSEEYPAQTAFKDSDSALTLLNKVVNKILKTKNLNDIGGIDNIFTLDNEGSLWTRANFNDGDVYDTVADFNVFNIQKNEGRYVEGDLVRIIKTGNVDPWEGKITSAIYKVGDPDIEVGVDNVTIDVAFTKENLHQYFWFIYDRLTKLEQNEITFTLLNEMLYQFPDCDWFMKTSYINMQIFDKVSVSPFIRPNELEAIVSNVLETKPYHTKLRTSTFTYSFENNENLVVDLEEKICKKVTLVYNRIENEVYGGWDTLSFDTQSYDNPPHVSNDFQYKDVMTDGNKQYIVQLKSNPKMYDMDVHFTKDGETFNPNDIGVEYIITKLQDSIVIDFNTEVQDVVIHVGIKGSFVDGKELDTDISCTRPYPYSFGSYNSDRMGSGIYEPSGNDERFDSEIEDSVVINVTTSFSGASGGFGMSPFDSTDYDEDSENVGDIKFTIKTGNDSYNENGVYTHTPFKLYKVSDLYGVGNGIDDGLSAGKGRYMPLSGFTSLKHNDRILVEGEDYTKEGSGIRFAEPKDYNVVYDGSDLFINGGIKSLCVNGKETTEYDIVSGQIVFRKFNYTTTTESELVKYSFSNEYKYNLNTPINIQNMFLYRDGVLVDDVKNSTSTQISLDPHYGDFKIHGFTGNKNIIKEVYTKEQVTINNISFTSKGNRLNTFVFDYDNRYMVEGVDYEFTKNGEIRYSRFQYKGTAYMIDVDGYKATHDVLDASGSNYDAIPRVFDKNNVIMFIDNEPADMDNLVFENEYNRIRWINAPAAGSKITIRQFSDIVSSRVTSVVDLVDEGDVISVKYHEGIKLGDTITVYDSKLDTNGLMLKNVQYDGSYDLIDGVIHLPVSDELLTIEYSGREHTDSILYDNKGNVIDYPMGGYGVVSGVYGLSQIDVDVSTQLLSNS